MICAIILLGLLAISVQGEDVCFSNVRDACGPVGGGIEKCTAAYSGVLNVEGDLQQYAATHISQNFQYLLMSAYFKNYIANREGFSKLYRKLADDAWDDSIDLIKYMAKRGFNMNYQMEPKKEMKIESYKMDELSSLAAALDRQKVLAEQAHEIHSEVTVRKNRYHDAETISFIEKEFVGKHSETVRNLAGHVNDLHRLIKTNSNSSLAVYLFDEYLNKVVE